MKQCPSPNFDARAAGNAIAYVVLHYTGMKSAKDALTRMCDASAKVSAHYVIDEDGSLIQLIDEKNRAWHAGQSFWRGETDMNSASIGIELVNPGHEFGYHPFPDAQINALLELLKDIFARYKLPPSALLAHSDIAPTRKEDPGELFPWQKLAEHGFGLWFDPTSVGLPFTENVPDTTGLLRAIGYQCPSGDESALQAAEKAFLRRYHPERLGLGFDQETLARAQKIAHLLR